MKKSMYGFHFTDYKPFVYIFENFEFQKIFEDYRLLKIGYSHSPEDRLRYMPKYEECGIIYKTEGGYDAERKLVESFSSDIVVHPFYGYYDRVKVKSKPYYSIEWDSNEMYNYLNDLRYGSGKDWGYTEWFVAKKTFKINYIDDEQI